MYDLDHRKVVDLDRGLFFVNYKSAEDTVSPPKVALSPAEGDERTIQFVLHPDAREPTLWEPRTGLVLRVNSKARLQVEVLPSTIGGSRVATVAIEPLPAGRLDPSMSPHERNSVGRFDLRSSAFKMLGHVAGRGDVAVGPNAWIAGPEAPSRIEGFALEWPDRPAGVAIRYAVQSANAQPGSGRMVPLGTFAGTRGRALPLTGLVLEMSGTEELEFAAEAIFLSAPTLRATGRRVVLSGPTGREALVGLRVTVERISRSSASEDSEPAATRQSPVRSGRVRVFRSRAPQDNVSR